MNIKHLLLLCLLCCLIFANTMHTLSQPEQHTPDSPLESHQQSKLKKDINYLYLPKIDPKTYLGNNVPSPRIMRYLPLLNKDGEIEVYHVDIEQVKSKYLKKLDYNKTADSAKITQLATFFETELGQSVITYFDGLARGGLNYYKLSSPHFRKWLAIKIIAGKDVKMYARTIAEDTGLFKQFYDNARNKKILELNGVPEAKPTVSLAKPLTPAKKIQPKTAPVMKIQPKLAAKVVEKKVNKAAETKKEIKGNTLAPIKSLPSSNPHPINNAKNQNKLSKVNKPLAPSSKPTNVRKPILPTKKQVKQVKINTVLPSTKVIPVSNNNLAKKVATSNQNTAIKKQTSQAIPNSKTQTVPVKSVSSPNSKISTFNPVKPITKTNTAAPKKPLESQKDVKVSTIPTKQVKVATKINTQKQNKPTIQTKSLNKIIPQVSSIKNPNVDKKPVVKSKPIIEKKPIVEKKAAHSIPTLLKASSNQQNNKSSNYTAPQSLPQSNANVASQQKTTQNSTPVAPKTNIPKPQQKSQQNQITKK